MYIKLFSAAAQRKPQRTRVERAESFAKQLTEVNETIQKVSYTRLNFLKKPV